MEKFSSVLKYGVFNHSTVEVIGVEAIDSAAMTESLRAREIVTLPSVP